MSGVDYFDKWFNFLVSKCEKRKEEKILGFFLKWKEGKKKCGKKFRVNFLLTWINKNLW